MDETAAVNPMGIGCLIVARAHLPVSHYKQNASLHGVSAHVGFPAMVAGTSPEGHEEACARNDHMSGRPYLGADVLNRGSVA